MAHVSRVCMVNLKRKKMMNNSTKLSTENRLVNFCKDLLGHDELATDSDFFDIGGNSLNAIKFLDQIEKHYGEDIISIDDLFDNAVICQLAKLIDSRC